MGIMREDERKIEAVLFDYGMVLSGPADPVAWARMQAILGVSGERFDAAYWRTRDAYDRGALSGVAYWRQVGEDVGRVVDESMLAGLIAADTALWTQENPPMIAWAQELQRRGVKTGILSNLGDAMEAGVRERFSWLEGFAHHTFSHRLGIAKPDRAIYAHAAEGLGVAPEEILFIDDREVNVRGAREAGMVGLLYAGHAAFVEAMRGLGLGWLL
jgi:putative hydrolase of the HAD superfamily